MACSADQKCFLEKERNAPIAKDVLVRESSGIGHPGERCSVIRAAVYESDGRIYAEERNYHMGHCWMLLSREVLKKEELQAYNDMILGWELSYAGRQGGVVPVNNSQRCSCREIPLHCNLEVCTKAWRRSFQREGFCGLNCWKDVLTEGPSVCGNVA